MFIFSTSKELLIRKETFVLSTGKMSSRFFNLEREESRRVSVSSRGGEGVFGDEGSTDAFRNQTRPTLLWMFELWWNAFRKSPNDELESATMNKTDEALGLRIDDGIGVVE